MSDLDALLNAAKKQWWQSRLILAAKIAFAALSVFLIFNIVLNLLGLSHKVIDSEVAFLSVFVFSFCGCLVYQRLSQRWATLNHTNVLHHINRTIAPLEESAELLFAPTSSHTPMQALQVKRIRQQLAEQEVNLHADALDFYDIKSERKPAFFSVFVALILLSVFSFTEPTESLHKGKNKANTKTPAVLTQDIEWQITITPPDYTQIKPQERLFAKSSASLNIEAPEGSLIEWRAQTQYPAILSLNITQQTPQVFVETGPNIYTASFELNAPTLYSITNLNLEKESSPEFYTLSVLRDQPPNIEIEVPIATVSEFKRSEKPLVDTQVLISDDYGLSEVYISASIAKGSGEAVKFRDEVFSFDSSEDLVAISTYAEGTGQPELIAKVARRYSKRWNFELLEMEPGDELYFTVNAIDNHPNSPQLSVSQTKILKWLDDDDVGITSDGILMDFIPEYFKSQRQIIIETIELIERKPLLTKEKFEDTAKSLAIAQSDLKLRYGQYLGDEFESGIMQTMEAGPAVPDESNGAHEHDHDHDESNNGDTADTHDHAHEKSNFEEQGISSGFDEIIEQFGHNHGEADSGAGPKRGQLNPRALMKRSIENMWQAELFLHLSDPVSALPYEQEALDYLNRARKAERVYVKRLGFKPPPVSEERRYEGELVDILEPNIQQTFKMPESSAIIKRRFLSYLSQASVYSEQMSEDALAVNQQLVSLLNEELAQPDRLTQRLTVLAILERMSIEKRWPLSTCENCLNQIMLLLWQDLQNPIAQPKVPKQKAEQRLFELYQQAMQP